MNKRVAYAVAIIGVLAGAGLVGCSTRLPEAPRPLVSAAIQPSLVRVEFTLQMDRGQPPQVSGWQRRCSGCGQYHSSDAGEVVEQERPLEAAGFVLSPTEVLVRDPMVHPRFVKSMAVRFGDQVVEATPAAYALNQTAMLLKLAAPLKGVKPLEFTTESTPPLLAVTYELLNGDWTLAVTSLPTAVATTAGGRKFRMVPSCLIVDKEGTPVGMTMNDELPIDESWRGSPLTWEAIAAKDLDKALGSLEKRFAQGIVRVALSFRSPKKSTDPTQRYRSMDDETGTEKNVLGAVIDANRVVVLANLTPKVTARLERITVHQPGSDPIPAKFTQSLKNYGAFIATLDKPVKGAVEPSEQPIMAWRNQLLLYGEVELQGEKCTTYFSHNRIPGFELGYRRGVFPETRTDAEKTVLFDRDGRLVAFPVVRRPKAGQEESWRGESPILTPVGHLSSFLFGEMAGEIDPSNIPLTEEEEARLAWLGVELQPLDRELARINKVSHLTRDGEIGGMVSYVYSGSPAAAAGIQPGDILVRLHTPDQPKPIEVEADEPAFGGRPFPWDRYETLSEQYFDQVPRPWPGAENSLNRVLTDLGFGTEFEVEFARGGEVIRKPFTVLQCPTHYDMAPKFKSEALGVTVRDLTFEVRRYFLRQGEDPGVIVDKIEPGSRASVSGMKPYEIVTHVNNEPVMNVADFERLVSQSGDLELSIKRMTKGRVVKIRRDTPATTTQPDGAPATQPVAE